MRGRPDKLPCGSKTSGNQVGVYRFVEPDLVEGTLGRGLEPIGQLPATALDGYRCRYRSSSWPLSTRPLSSPMARPPQGRC